MPRRNPRTIRAWRKPSRRPTCRAARRRRLIASKVASPSFSRKFSRRCRPIRPRSYAYRNVLWATFRQSDCQVYYGNETGTIATINGGDCVISRTNDRIKDLQAFMPRAALMLHAPGRPRRAVRVGDADEFVAGRPRLKQRVTQGVGRLRWTQPSSIARVGPMPPDCHVCIELKLSMSTFGENSPVRSSVSVPRSSPFPSRSGNVKTIRSATRVSRFLNDKQTTCRLS